MTRSLCVKLAAMLFSSLLVGTSSAADAPATPAPQPAAPGIEQIDDLDEIWVRGQSLSVIIEKAEDSFFALYNKLNRNNQYDVYCGQMQLQPGSMIMLRACTPGFIVFNSYDVLRNRVAYSTGAMGACSNTSTYMAIQYIDEFGDRDRYYMSQCLGSSDPVYMGVPTELLLMEKRPAYLKNIRKVIASDPRLQDMMKNLGGLYDEMDLAQRHYVKVRGDLGKGPMSFKPRSRLAKPSGGPRAL